MCQREARGSRSGPEKSFISVDIFSCKHFDVDLASRDLQDAFGMTKVETNVLDRGTEFPKEINGAVRLVENERRRVSRPAPSRNA